jgi:hypothetical protein
MAINPSALDHLGPRKRGLVVLGVGLVLAYFGYYVPLTSAQQHEQSILVSTMAPLLAPFSIGIGLVWLILGERYVPIFGSHKQATFLGWVMMWAMFLIGIICYFLLRTHLRSQGYGFR